MRTGLAGREDGSHLLWQAPSPAVPFLFGAALALAAAILMFFRRPAGQAASGIS